MFYIHKETGAFDSQSGWIESYTAEELAGRGLTAEQAFEEDEGETLFCITPDYCTRGDTEHGGYCPTCSLVNYRHDCRNNRVTYPEFKTA